MPSAVREGYRFFSFGDAMLIETAGRRGSARDVALMRTCSTASPTSPSPSRPPMEAPARDVWKRHGAPCSRPASCRWAPKGTVKGDASRPSARLGAQIVLANTYHLALRPGSDTVRQLGGLHRFMAWDGPLLTDSGGFQVFSLRDTASIRDDGVVFRSVYDGSPHLFTPERAMAEQRLLGADLVMCFDECPPAGASRYRAGAGGGAHHGVGGALRRGPPGSGRSRHRWSPDAAGHRPGWGGARHFAARARRACCSLGFPGYAIGGLSVGEDREATLEATAYTAGLLPADRVRYFMGIGDPMGLLEVIERGVDLFDCVLPTRTARMGTAFTREGRLNLRNARHARSTEPLDADCPLRGLHGIHPGRLAALVSRRRSSDCSS